MKDIEGIDEIKSLVDSFYSKVVKDETIGYIFQDVQKVNWNFHLSQMYSFWHTVLFGVMSYKGNPMLKHFYVNKNEPLSPVHFKQWLSLWEETIDEQFVGIKADLAKQRAVNMANGIQKTLKIID
ncbi:MAG: group III truncated hemoglobin [Flavobacteriales bacterium]|nr:group III truncated hemoglobin [Flavobacteriales bacterium]